MQKRFVLMAGALLSGALACALPGGGELPDVDTVATSVALTLEAAGVGVTPAAPPPVEPSPPLRVVYVDDGDIWVWNEGAGGSEIHDSADTVGDVRISEDGQVVAFTTRNAAGFSLGLFAVNSDGTNLRTLVNAAALASYAPEATAGVGFSQFTFVPGTHVVAFGSRAQFEIGSEIKGDLRTVNADGGPVSTVLSPGQGGQFYYSPDGSQVALTTPTTVSIINADGTNRRDVLTYTAVITYTEAPFYPVPRWGADSAGLRVVIPSADILAPDTTITTYNLPLDGSGATVLGTIPAIPPSFPQTSSISPDLSKVAFTRRVGAPEDNTWALHFANVDGSGDVDYFTSAPTFEDWSPASNRVVYQDNSHLFVGEAGVAPVSLPDTDAGIDPQWADANRVVYLSGSFGAWELRLFDLTTGTHTVIANPVGDFIPFALDN
jgi:hypothetical protein